MLKKNDLAKQFEIVVQQEIKNYNDSLNLVLQSINELRESINDVHEETAENHAILHSFQTSLSIKLENIEEIFSKFYKKIEQQFYDQLVINNRNSYQMNEMSSAINSKIRGQDHFEKKIDEIETQFFKENEKSLQIHKVSAKAIDELMTWTKSSLKKHREEIDSKPHFQHPSIDALELKLLTYKVDSEALLKELRITRNDLMVAEKNIENLYTIIERLNKPGVNT